MRYRATPLPWRTGFTLYRRQQGQDSLGNPTACYDLTAPDAQVPREEGLALQPPRRWNGQGQGGDGLRVQENGEVPYSCLEGYLRSPLEVEVFDRLEAAGELWEVTRLERWPGHRVLSLRRVQ